MPPTAIERVVVPLRGSCGACPTAPPPGSAP
jgi:Fe-S cluster biogenesis protein NfuA